MPALEDDEEVKLEPEKTIAEKMKFNPQNLFHSNILVIFGGLLIFF